MEIKMLETEYLGVTIKLTKNLRNKKSFTLEWTDNVVNTWTESFDELSVALARVSALISCGESLWEKFFRFDENQFAEQAKAFLNYVTK
jgi:hypothetical protein